MYGMVLTWFQYGVGMVWVGFWYGFGIDFVDVLSSPLLQFALLLVSTGGFSLRHGSGSRCQC